MACYFNDILNGDKTFLWSFQCYNSRNNTGRLSNSSNSYSVEIQLTTISNGNGNKELKLALIFHDIMFAFVMICFYNSLAHFFLVFLPFGPCMKDLFVVSCHENSTCCQILAHFHQRSPPTQMGEKVTEIGSFAPFYKKMMQFEHKHRRWLMLLKMCWNKFIIIHCVQFASYVHTGWEDTFNVPF